MKVKICGLSTQAGITAALTGGADWLGFVFCAESPRAIDSACAQTLFQTIPENTGKVGLVVNADDAFLDALISAVPLDMIQLHGDETPARCRDIKARFNLPVMKAIGIETHKDLAQIADYESVCDMILLDAKPPRGTAQRGGHGQGFDWRVVAGYPWRKPWMLAGGLSADNIHQAVAESGAMAVDISSGIERIKGVKDPDLIRDFLKIAKSINSEKTP